MNAPSVAITPLPWEKRPAAGVGASPRCAFTIDVEDWYQSSVDFDAPITERVLRNVERVCAVLDQCKVKGTFFVQGRVAETFPRLLRDLLQHGHEIQSHGHTHRPLFSMDRPALRTELEYARKTIEDACGQKVNAFRAPDFSIVRDNLWALDELAEMGFDVDSSVFPLRTHRYGVAGWPTGPHRVRLASGRNLLEVPVAIWKGGPFKLPVAGGGYFRLLPQRLLDRALRSILAGGEPAIIYCHPYEFSPEELAEYRGRASAWFLFTQGLGRGWFIQRVRQLLSSLPFVRFDEAVAPWRV